MVRFSGILDTGWIKTVTRFKGKLVKMIKAAESKCDDYSILLKIITFYPIGVMDQLKKNFFINSILNNNLQNQFLRKK